MVGRRPWRCLRGWSSGRRWLPPRLPSSSRLLCSEQSVPAEYRDMIVVYATTRGWSVVVARIPGHEELAAFFAKLSEATGGRRHSFQALTEGLSASMMLLLNPQCIDPLLDGREPRSDRRRLRRHLLRRGHAERVRSGGSHPAYVPLARRARTLGRPGADVRSVLPRAPERQRERTTLDPVRRPRTGGSTRAQVCPVSKGRPSAGFF